MPDVVPPPLVGNVVPTLLLLPGSLIHERPDLRCISHLHISTGLEKFKGRDMTLHAQHLAYQETKD